MAVYKWALTTAGSPPSGEGYESTTYTDVSTWSAAQGRSLTAGHQAYLDAFDDWASGLTCDQEQIDSSHGWATDSSNFITLRVYAGEGHGGAIGGGFYAKDADGVGYGAIRPISVRVDVIGWEFNSAFIPVYDVGSVSGTPILDKCIFVSTGLSSYTLIGKSSNNAIVLNSLFVNGNRAADKVTLVNCTVDNFSSYAFLGRNVTTIKNSIVTNSIGSSDPFYQEATGSDYNATDYSSTAGANSITSIIDTDNYNAIGSDDYSIKDTDADIYDAGIDLSGTYSHLAYDIAGNPRSSTYSIGAYEWVSAGGGDYTLTAESGTYTFSGSAAALTATKKLSAEAGAFTFAGSDATITYNPVTSYSLTAESGSYSFAGSDVSFTIGRGLTAESGSFAFAGSDTEFTVNRSLLAEAGSYSFNGADASLIYTPVGGYTIVAEAGSFSFAGADATFKVSRALTANQSAYAFEGSTAALTYGRKLTAEAGSYAFAGSDATFSRGAYALTADAASYTFNGSAVTFTYSGQSLWTEIDPVTTTWTEI